MMMMMGLATKAAHSQSQPSKRSSGTASHEEHGRGCVYADGVRRFLCFVCGGGGVAKQSKGGKKATDEPAAFCIVEGMWARPGRFERATSQADPTQQSHTLLVSMHAESCGFSV